VGAQKASHNRLGGDAYAASVRSTHVAGSHNIVLRSGRTDFFSYVQVCTIMFSQKKVCTIMGFYVPYDIIAFLFVVWTVHMYSSVPVNCTMEREKQDAQQCRAIILAIRV
jgi:hypothetical protein